MDSHNFKPFYFFTLLPAFTVGIQDGINPCGFASALIFIMYLSVAGHTQKSIFWLGLLFIVSSVLAHFGLTIGVLDFIIIAPAIVRLLRIFYFLLAATFLILGIFNIVDRLLNKCLLM